MRNPRRHPLVPILLLLLLLSAPVLAGDDVEEAIRVLGSDRSWMDRASAARTLGRSGDERALEPLLAVLAREKEHTFVLSAAVEALGELGDERAVPHLLPLARQRTHSVSSSAVTSLGQIGGGRAGAGLIALLEEIEDESLLIRAIEALGKIGDPRAVPAIERHLRDAKDRRGSKCSAAARALARLGAPGVDALIAGLDDERSRVGWNCVRALAGCPEDRVVDAVLEALEDPSLRAESATTLAELGAARAIEKLAARLTGEADTYAKAALATALLRLGDDRGRGVLDRMLRSQDLDVRWCALAALEGHADAGFRDALKENARHPDSRMRRSAALGLSGLRGVDGVLPALEKLLDDEEESVRIAAVRAIVRLGAPETLPVLLGLLRTKGEDCPEGREAERALPGLVSSLCTLEAAKFVPVLLDSLAGLREFSDDAWRTALNALAESGDERAAPDLVQAILERGLHGSPKRWAAGLAAMGPAILPDILEVLEEEGPLALRFSPLTDAIRAMGAAVRDSILSRIREGRAGKDPFVEIALLAMLEDGRVIDILFELPEEVFVKLEPDTAPKLADLAGTPHLERITAALETGRPTRARFAAYLLAGLAPRLPRDNWEEALRLATVHEDTYVRRMAVRSIERSGGPDVLPLLRPFLRDADAGVRKQAVKVLGDLGSPDAIELLVAALDERLAGRVAAKALDNLGWKPGSDRERVFRLVALRDGDGLVREWATARPVLLGALECPRPAVVENAAFALIALGFEETVAPLVGAIDERGTLRLAEAYWNSERPELREAAERWDEAHEEDIRMRIAFATPIWGKGW